MHRFFVTNNLIGPSEVVLSAEISRQINRVLRLKAGTQIILLDNLGYEYPAILSTVSDQGCDVKVLDKIMSTNEPETRLTIILGLTQREKFEWILQKCTEIGVSTFLPVFTSRTLVQKSADVQDKYARWNKILAEAAEQSHRGKIPNLLPVLPYKEAISVKEFSNSLKLILWEDEKQIGIKQIFKDHSDRKVTLLIGPEGGLSKEEVDLSVQNGFISVSLGKRILRMETAAMVASALVIHEKG